MSEVVKGVDVYDQARTLFFIHYLTVTEISRRLSIPRRTVDNWVKREKWRETRQKELAEYTQDVRDQNLEAIHELFRLGLPMIKGALIHRAEGEPLSMREASDLSQVLLSFDKLMRLETGQATERVEALAPITIEDLKAALEKDAFIELKGNEYGSAPAAQPGEPHDPVVSDLSELPRPDSEVLSRSDLIPDDIDWTPSD